MKNHSKNNDFEIEKTDYDNHSELPNYEAVDNINRITNRDEKFKCYKCGTSFSSADWLGWHLTYYHD